MAERGLNFSGEITEDGKLHRFKPGEDKDPSGWYVLYKPNPISAGAFGCWRRNINETWHANGTGHLSPRDLASLKASWREAEAARERDDAARHLRMAESARAYLAGCVAANIKHDYLQLKNVPANGLRQNPEGELVVPLSDSEGKLWSYQTIDSSGSKLFMPGGRVRGCFFRIGDRGEGPLVVCEGYATGASIHQATGWDVCCAMNCGNLPECCIAIRKSNPGRRMVVACDDDRNTEGNPGLTKGMEAAKKASCLFVSPVFPDSYEGDGSDFNDLHIFCGLPEVKACLFKLLNYPVACPIGELKIPEQNDPDELLKHRFLCRGGGLLLVGPTGIGKSSFGLQCLALLANGMPAFEIEPTRCLNSLYIQAENDDGDIADMRNGIAKGLQFTEGQRSRFFNNVLIHTEIERLSKSFFDRVVIPLVSSTPSLDILVIDPALSYIGAEARDQKAVGEFLRSMLTPVIKKYNLAAIVIHHTNKPPSGNQKPDWSISEMAYLGSGSIEWANWARAILALQSTKTPGLFKLNAAKRGARLDWKSTEGDKCYSKLIKHYKSDGVICWLDADESDSPPSDGGRPRKAELDDFVALLEPENLSAGRWIAMSKTELGISRATFYRLLDAAEKEGRVLKSKINGKWTSIKTPVD